MKYRVRWNSAALADLGNILSNLKSFSLQAGDALRAKLNDIANQLDSYPRSSQSTFDISVRRAVLRTCRFILYFRLEEERVEILAILPQMARDNELSIQRSYR